MSKPVSVLLKLSSLKIESDSRYRSLIGPSACASSSCRQSRASCAEPSEGTKIDSLSRAVRVVQSVAGVLRLARKSSHPVTRGATKQATLA